MPHTAASSSARKTAFRLLAIVCALLFLGATVIFFVALLVPTPRAPIAQDAAYESYQYYQRPEHSKKISLTFDDGPEPEATAHIVETLKRHGVPATFFFIGAQVLAYPDLARLVAAEGFEVGNHTFTHALSVHDSPERLRAELGATEQLLELTVGTHIRYYRPPYLLAIGIDPAPNPWISTIPANNWALALGYVPVGIDIDSHDWDAQTSQEVVAKFKQQVADNKHIVLFHDTPYTAAALDEILTWLTAEGYQLVPLTDVLAPTAASGAVMARTSVFTPAESAYLFFISHTWQSIGVLGVMMVGFLLLRIAVLGLLLLCTRQQVEPPPLVRYPLISVLIPAYNEEDNIEAAIKSVLQNLYPRREVLVLNDGSTDNTHDIVRRVSAQYPKAVRHIELANGGKARALTLGAHEASGEILVVLDADAVLDPDALHAFARHFADPGVGAVAGKVYTTNTRGLLAKFQALEYCVGQNIEKRAISALGIVGVVPGPAGAWRRQAVLDAGGFPEDTLVEDQDMTLTLLRWGWRIPYEPRAIAYTETPATLRSFLAQRFRWVYGTIQCFWKHAGGVVERPLSPMSLVLIPNIFIFGIVLPLLYPIVDTVLVVSILFGWWHEAVLPILAFTILDILFAAWGLHGERRLYKLIFVVPLLRVVYRQLLYYTVVRGLVRAIEGTGVAWNKVARLGDTRRFFDEQLTIPTRYPRL